MKKCYLIFYILFSFFIFSFNLKADTITYEVTMTDGTMSLFDPIGVEGVKIFNYFEEKKNNTDFYNLLNYYGDTFKDYLCGLSNCHGSNYNSDLIIFTKSEYEHIINDLSSMGDIDINNIEIPSDYTHVVFDIRNYKSIPGVDYSHPTFNDNFLQVHYGSNMNYDVSSHRGNVYYFNGFDFVNQNEFKLEKNDNYFTFVRMFGDYYFYSYEWTKSGWWIFGSKKYTGSDFSYLYSKFYYLDTDIASSKSPNLILNLGTACFDGKCEVVDEKYNKYGLDYLVLNPISKNGRIVGLNKVLKPNIDNYNIPETYSSISFDLTRNINLFPKTTCDLSKYGLYLYTSSSKTVNLYLHTISSDDKLGYLSSYYSSFQTLNNGLLAINPLYKVKNINDNSVTTFTDEDFIKYYYTFMAQDNKSIYTVYYNSECYTISYSGGETSFINPQTGNTVIFNGDTPNWSDPENVGKPNSIDFFDTPGITSTIGNIATDFYQSMLSIVSLATDLFSGLPSSVQSLLITSFTLGIIIILIKLFL